MNEEEIKKTIVSILKKIAPDTNPAILKNTDNISEVLEIDSFDYLQFIVGLDNTLGIKIPEEDYGKIQKLGDLLDYLLLKIKT